MNILITGGAGFIGSNIASFHLLRGDSVWVIDDLSSGRLQNISELRKNPKFVFEEGLVQDWINLDRAVDWADYIYHMAAVIGQRLVISSPVRTVTNNVGCLQKVLETMAESKKKNRLILASSSCVYSHTPPAEDTLLYEEAPLTFLSNEPLQITYSISKLFDEVLTNSFVIEKGIDCVIARIFNTIGINQRSRYGMVVPNFIKQAINNEPITVFGSGEQSRAFINVKDTVKGLFLLLENPATKGLVVNIGSNECCSINQLAELVRSKVNSRSEIRHISYREAYGINFIDVEQRCPSIKRLQSLTGFLPEWTLEKTIEDLVKIEQFAKM